jgi:hypothetical protein
LKSAPAATGKSESAKPGKDAGKAAPAAAVKAKPSQPAVKK